jgi:hypothetical protein
LVNEQQNLTRGSELTSVRDARDDPLLRKRAKQPLDGDVRRPHHDVEIIRVSAHATRNHGHAADQDVARSGGGKRLGE